MLALIAGQGRLPTILSERLMADNHAFRLCEVEGFPIENHSGYPPIRFRIEHLGSFLHNLRNLGAAQVCFAGRVHRPKLNMSAVDAATTPLLPRIATAMQQGDDAALRVVLAIFEDAGFKIRTVQDIAPELLPDPGVLTKVQPAERDIKDAARAETVVTALGSGDVGQGCVVQQGQVLAVETLPGTDWMLTRLAEAPFDARPDADYGSGLYYKAAKPDQDRRIDLPTIGPETVKGALAAGLGGLVIEAGSVLLIDREATIAAADTAGLFLWVRERG